MLINNISALELTQKFIKSALLVGFTNKLSVIRCLRNLCFRCCADYLTRRVPCYANSGLLNCTEEDIRKLGIYRLDLLAKVESSVGGGWV